ncbi:MAG: hypothetical protein Q8K67_04195 [Geothrix sp.]|nr:hypothetical protein [Geothrix sp.]
MKPIALLIAGVVEGLLLGCGGGSGGPGNQGNAGSGVADISLPAATLGPDLMGVVNSTQWVANGGSTLAYDSVNQGFPFTTDASGNTNHEDWQKSIRSPMVNLLAGHAYQFVARMKADVFPRGQNLVFTVRDAGDSTQFSQYAWNVSRAGVWEEVYMTVFPTTTGNWRLDVWVSPTIKYTTTPSMVFIAPDVDVYELPVGQEVATLHGVNVAADKDAFVSSTQRIDGLGNVYVLQNGSWKHVFPRMMYKGVYSTVADRAELFRRYKEYGFTGVMDIWAASEAQALIDAGLEHISINANYANTVDMANYLDQVDGWATTNSRQQNVLWYNYDNENASVADYDYQQVLQAYIDAHHQDPQTGKRRHPIYFLNGQVGLPRTCHNAGRSVMDITGSYVGSLAALGETAHIPPVPTLLTQFMTQNQRAPVTVIQLQTYLNEGFIPSLFYGLITGGRAISVWRDGSTQSFVKPDFRDNVWAPAFRDDVSPKLDQMLPIIEQPHFTTWKAWTNQFPYVRIGTRELNGTGYLILANFGVTDLPVVVSLQGRQATKALDMFTGAAIADVVNGSFQFTLGHYNSGYRVIRLM